MRSVQLPGGLLVDGTRYRNATFRPLTGAVELVISEAQNTNESYPVFVTRVLSAAVESIGPEPFSPSIAKALSVADRQVLLLHLSIMLNGDLHWIQSTCTECDNRFDLPINRSEIPIVEAPGGYPVFSGKLGDKTIDLHVLNGELEEKLAGINDDEAALHAVINHAVNGGGTIAPMHLTKEELSELEQQLEDGSPAVAEELASHCPYCQTAVTFDLDFSAGLLAGTTLLEEIHEIATHYHWSEETITALPRRRRQDYLKMIHATRGIGS